MARRPDLFDKARVREGLIQAGCPEAYADAYLGDLKLFVPLLFRELGPDRVLELVNSARGELGLRDEDTYWKDGATYFTRWAQDALEAYKASKGIS